ncbi:hypothetical protein DIZ76_013801 [Coccidioides immitis]|nr:hypothetical protein DIZ76_013801 [Coccidioides immitis]
MTRVLHRAGSAQAARARSKVPRTSLRKHKIIMETVTQEKKKLRSVISFEAKAPPGYTFIPAGNPKFTTACKEICRKDGLKVYTVSTTPHQGMHNLSQQVHRIGYHFPSVVVATVCMDRGVFLSSTGKVMPYRHLPSHGHVRELMRERRADSEISQTTINAEARDAIKDLFPNIPDKDLNQIIKTAFRKGKRKVGTAVELPLARRVQLAVVAHIRHVYTDYDRLLRLMSFQEARAAVEEPCLAKLVQWRGDDESGETVLEDVFREVIVISDDEDDDVSEDNEQTQAERDSSVEFVCSNTVVKELQTWPLQYGNSSTVDRSNVPEPSEDEAPPGVRFIPDPPRKRKTGDKKKIDRRGFSRYQAWDRARDRYKDMLNTRPGHQPAGQSSGHDSLPMSTEARLHEMQPTRQLPYTGELQPRPLHILHPVDAPVSVAQRSYRDVDDAASQVHMRRPEPPKIIRLSDGSIFERADKITRPGYDMGPGFIPPSSLHPRGYIPSEQVKYNPTSSKPYAPMQETIHSDSEFRGRTTAIGHYPDEHGREYGPDPGLLMSRKRDSNGLLINEAYREQPPLEDLSGRMNIIEIDDGRYHFPPKRSKILVHNSIESSHPEGHRETSELLYPAGDMDTHREKSLYDSKSAAQGILINKTHISSSGYSDPPFNHRERLGAQTDRRSTGEPHLTEIPTRKDPLTSDFVDRGHPHKGQGLRHLPLVNHSIHAATNKPSVVKADSSLYGVRDDTDNVKPNQFSQLSRPRHVLLGPEPREGREVQLKRSGHANSVAMRVDSPKRRSFLSNQDTRSSRIYSHDFVRPVASPGNKEPLRYQPHSRLHDDTAGQMGRHPPKYLQQSDLCEYTSDRMIAYEAPLNRSLSPPIHHFSSRIANHRPAHAPRLLQQFPVSTQQETYDGRIVEDSYRGILPEQKRYFQQELETRPPNYREPSVRREAVEDKRPHARHVVLRDPVPIGGN